VRRFLASCTYESDQKQFGQRDYWQPPEQFEQTKKGDCEDFAVRSGRQLLRMNYSRRLVIGTAGRYGEGHAWVTFEKDGKTFLLEALRWPFGLAMPRLSTLRYHPKFSVGWNGKTISCYSHDDQRFSGSLQTVAPLVGEWVFRRSSFYLRLIAQLTKGITLKLFGIKRPRSLKG
jgi:hypothetical protein